MSHGGFGRGVLGEVCGEDVFSGEREAEREESVCAIEVEGGGVGVVLDDEREDG